MQRRHLRAITNSLGVLLQPGHAFLMTFSLETQVTQACPPLCPHGTQLKSAASCYSTRWDSLRPPPGEAVLAAYLKPILNISDFLNGRGINFRFSAFIILLEESL